MSGESGGDDSRTERQRVGDALDQLTLILQPYVGAAMTEKYGVNWGEHVSDKRAARRKDGRRFVVSTNDLLVLLQQLQFEKIKPWGNQLNSQRIAAYAAEIITVRHLLAHSGSLQGEYVRLVDTIKRLLDCLDLPLPDELSLRDDATPAAVSTSTDAILPTSLLDAPGLIADAVDRLGEDTRRPAELFLAWSEGTAYQDIQWPSPPFDLHGTKQLEQHTEYVEATISAAVRLHAVVSECDAILSASPIAGTELNRALAAMSKWHALAQGHQLREILLRIGLKELYNFKATKDRVLDDRLYDLFDLASPEIGALESSLEEVSADRSRLPREAIRYASKVPAGVALVQTVLREAHFAFYLVPADRGGEMSESELQHLREAIAHQRMLIGLAPRADVESERVLASLLMLEGRLCNDLGLSEDAMRAFARADEIIDRYPLADPSFAFDAPLENGPDRSS